MRELRPTRGEWLIQHTKSSCGWKLQLRSLTLCPPHNHCTTLRTTALLYACSVASVVSDSLWLCGLSLLGSSVHGILQANILEWVAMPYSRGSSWPRGRTCVSYVSCTAGGFFTNWAVWATREALVCPWQFKIFHVSPYQCIAICKSAETAPRDHEFSTSFHMCVDRKASMPNGRNEKGAFGWKG